MVGWDEMKRSPKKNGQAIATVETPTPNLPAKLPRARKLIFREATQRLIDEAIELSHRVRDVDPDLALKCLAEARNVVRMAAEVGGVIAGANVPGARQLGGLADRIRLQEAAIRQREPAIEVTTTQATNNGDGGFKEDDDERNADAYN